MSQLALVPASAESPTYGDEEIFADAIAAEHRAEASEARVGSADRWRAADDYAELVARGHAQQKIAARVGKSQQHISFCLACVKAYYLGSDRPLFNRVYHEVRGFKGSLLSSNSEEWFTPAEYLESVRAVLGTIDLDPASCEAANATVEAARFFSKDDDGLLRAWAGRLFVNPPYGRLSRLFMDKLRWEYEEGGVDEAIALVSAYSTETIWFQPLFSYLVCFADHRLRGWPHPTFGSAFVYLGRRETAFVGEFSRHGAIVKALA